MCGGGTNKRRVWDTSTTIPTSHDVTALRGMRHSSEREEGQVDRDIDQYLDGLLAGHGRVGEWGALLSV